MTSPPDHTPQPVDPLQAWSASRQRAEIEAAAQAEAQQEARRDAVLASDADRDVVCQLLADAFGQGRLDSTELDVRTSRALAARTHGDLDDVLYGLVAPGPFYRAPTPPAERQPVHAAAAPDRGQAAARFFFWVVGFFSAPFIFFGTILLLAGNDAGDRVAGIVMLVLFLPGLVALYRKGHPRE